MTSPGGGGESKSKSPPSGELGILNIVKPAGPTELTKGAADVLDKSGAGALYKGLTGTIEHLVGAGGGSNGDGGGHEQ